MAPIGRELLILEREGKLCHYSERVSLRASIKQPVGKECNVKRVKCKAHQTQ